MIRDYLKRTRSEATHTLMAAGENTISENENQYAYERSRLAIVAG